MALVIRTEADLDQLNDQQLEQYLAFLDEAEENDWRPTPTFWLPHEKQERVYEIIERAKRGSRLLIGYGGAAGGGKTDEMAELALDMAKANPGSRILVGRADFVDLRSTTLERFDALTPPGHRYRRYDTAPVFRDIRDPNNPEWPKGVVSRVYFRGVKDARNRIGSEAYSAILLEEAHEIALADVTYLLTRLRHTPHGYGSGDVVRPLIVAFNPFPGFATDWFLRGRLDVSTLPEDVQLHFIPSRMSDNPGLDPGYESFLRATLPPSLAQRLIDGIPGAVENAIYEQLDVSLHRAKLPAGLPMVDGAIGSDFGRTHLSPLVAITVDSFGRRWVRESWAGDVRGDIFQIKQNADRLKDKYRIKRGRADTNAAPLAQYLGFSVANRSRMHRIGLTHRLLNSRGPVGSLWRPGVTGFSGFESAGLIIVEDGPGNDELWEEMEAYHYRVISTEGRLELEPARIKEDRVAAMEDAVEELEEYPIPSPGSVTNTEGGTTEPYRPSPQRHTPEPSERDRAPVEAGVVTLKRDSSEGMPGARKR